MAIGRTSNEERDSSGGPLNFNGLGNFKESYESRPIVPTSSNADPPPSKTSYDVPMAVYPPASAAQFPKTESEITKIFNTSIAKLNEVLESKHFERLDGLLGSTTYWRDHLGISLIQYTTLVGAENIITYLENTSKYSIRKFEIEKGRAAGATSVDPFGKLKCLESRITFENEHGRGRGIITLLQDTRNNDEWRFYKIFTTLSELKDFPASDSLPKTIASTSHNVPPTMNWREVMEEKRDFRHEEPTVLIVGAGHSGLMTAARLSMLGIINLIIDKQGRSGDSWRTRYHDLSLHDSCWMNTMPYMSYPSNWPFLATKDKAADFMEMYEKALELIVWNQSEVVNSKWDEKELQWSVDIDQRMDGQVSRRTFHPRHIVQATGLNGEPNIPNIKGIKDFKGKLLHTSQIGSIPRDISGTKIVVIGTGTSGHDMAQSYYHRGADVTIVQRSPVHVVGLTTVHAIMAKRWNKDTNPDDGDTATLAAPTTLFKRAGSDMSKILMQTDKPMLDGLRNVGFRIIEDEPPAILPLSIGRAGGFYIDIGASSLIGQGKIKHKYSPGEISHLTSNTVVFPDGEEIEADQIVFATGYGNGKSRTRKVFGDEVADSIHSIWGFDEEGEIRGTWRRSGHKAFWVAAGPFWISRYYSRLLALQIKAVEEGLSEL